MPSASSRLEILIEAKNNASNVLKTVEVDLQGLNKAAGSAAGGLGGMSGLLGAAGIAGIGALGAAAAGAVVDMAKTAAETERLSASFDQMATAAGQSGDAMLAAMQQASRGTVSNAELMASANRAMLLGVADSAGEMSQLLEIAGARGKAMGETTSQAFSDLVTAVGRLSPMIADNLGITIDLQQAYDDYAKQLHVTASQLDETQKKQAFLNSIIKDSTDIVNANKAAGSDAASNFERMDAAITNAKDALGALFSPAVAAIAQSIADATVKATDGIKQMAEEQGKVNQGWDLGALHTQLETLTTNIGIAEETLQKLKGTSLEGGEAWDRLTSSLALMQAQLGSTKQQMLEMSAGTDAAAAAHQKLDIQLNFTVSGLGQLGAAAAAAKMGLDDMGQRLPWLVGQLAALTAQSDAARAALAGIQSSAVSSLQSAAEAAVPILGANKVSSMYDERKKKLGEQIEILTRYGYTTDQATFKALELEKAAAEPFVSAVAAAKEAEKANTHAAASVDQLSNAYEDLRGKVQGVLQGALDTGTGVDAQKALEAMGFPREDAINENARRLADIAQNGLKNQDWLGQFQQEVPDIWKMIRLAQNPQEEAAHLLQDFQDGLLTSPIDKAKAKEIVRRQIMGDQNMADLANEIAGELSAEMGVPMQQALSAAQGTLGGAGGAGGAAGTSFADGMVAATSDSDTGGSIVAVVDTQLRAKFPLLANAGRDAGKAWGTAFLSVVGDSVPAALVQILVDVVTPGVMAKFSQRATLQGATP